jgi:hypothetical protein
MKWYILIAVALVVGAIIGYFATTKLETIGCANYFSKQLLDDSEQSMLISYADCINDGGHTHTVPGTSKHGCFFTRRNGDEYLGYYIK